VRDLERKLVEHDTEEAKNAKLFNPADLLVDAKTIRQKAIPGLGLVNYSELSFDEVLSVSAIEDKKEQSKTILWMMLRKAYPDVKREDIGRYPSGKVVKLLDLLKETGDFLPAQKKSSPGSRLTRTRK
jgi:hypothetical protein